MIVVTRQDGVRFIAQAYREQLLTLNKRVLLQEIHHLASQQGQFVCFIRNMKRELEAMFSKEQGFLLGELVWDYFGRPDHLIYCESIADTANCFLIIVRDGAVYFDNKLPCEQVHQEIMPLLTDDHPYEIYTYGDVPLRNTETFGNATFMLPKKLVANFNQLKSPAFPALLASAEFELQPLPEALHSKYLRHNHFLLMLAGSLLVIVTGALFFWPSHTVVAPVQTAVTTTAYQQALTMPAPNQIIDDIIQKMEALYLVPGWELDKMNYDGHRYQMILHSNDGDVWYLRNWAAQHAYDVHMQPEGMRLESVSSLPMRLLPVHETPFRANMDHLMQRLAQVLPNNAIAVGNLYQSGTMQQTMLTLTINDVSPDVLSLIGDELKTASASLSLMDLSIKNGLISGKLQLSLWGTAA